MKTLVCTYKEAQLYQIPFPKLKNEDDDYCVYSIRAEKSERYRDGIDDGLGSQPLSKEEAIAKFKDKIDKHLCALKTGENLDDLLQVEDYQQEHTGLLQWESDVAFDGGGDFDDNWD